MVSCPIPFGVIFQSGVDLRGTVDELKQFVGQDGILPYFFWSNITVRGRCSKTVSDKRHLPHFQPPGATLFITFRLAHSIPVEVLKQLAEEVRHFEIELEQVKDQAEHSQKADLFYRRMFAKWDHILDLAQTGPCYLSNLQIAALITESLHYRDNRVFTLESYCVMPNHVHLVCTPLPKDDGTFQSLPGILHSLKRYTARQANLILGREGDFWQHENYDHVVWDNVELERILTYVVYNPVKAGFVECWQDWEWTYCKYDIM